MASDWLPLFLSFFNWEKKVLKVIPIILSLCVVVIIVPYNIELE